jgi:hypothetical protein
MLKTSASQNSMQFGKENKPRFQEFNAHEKTQMKLKKGTISQKKSVTSF